MRGSTYAAMVIPAGTNPDAMVMDKNYPKKRTFKRPSVVSCSYLLDLLIFHIHKYRIQRELEMYTQIVKFPHLSQFQAECIWMCKLSNIRRSLLISQQKESKELQLNFTWIDHQYHSSSQRCHPRKTVKQLKFMKVIMSFSTSMRKSSQC